MQRTIMKSNDSAATPGSDHFAKESGIFSSDMAEEQLKSYKDDIDSFYQQDLELEALSNYDTSDSDEIDQAFQEMDSDSG